jgi:PadR family transcriptional regulator AphA
MARGARVSLQPIVLGLLMFQPRHGYDLFQEFSHGLGQVWEIGQSQLYAQLKQLEEVGLVTVQTELQTSRPPRKVYRLIPQGQAAFEKWVYQPTPYLRYIQVEFLARLFFFYCLSLPGLEQRVARQKAVCQEQVNRLSWLASGADDSFRRCVLEFRQG